MKGALAAILAQQRHTHLSSIAKNETRQELLRTQVAETETTPEASTLQFEARTTPDAPEGGASGHIPTPLSVSYDAMHLSARNARLEEKLAKALAKNRSMAKYYDQVLAKARVQHENDLAAAASAAARLQDEVGRLRPMQEALAKERGECERLQRENERLAEAQHQSGAARQEEASALSITVTRLTEQVAQRDAELHVVRNTLVGGGDQNLRDLLDEARRDRQEASKREAKRVSEMNQQLTEIKDEAMARIAENVEAQRQLHEARSQVWKAEAEAERLRADAAEGQRRQSRAEQLEEECRSLRSQYQVACDERDHFRLLAKRATELEEQQERLDFERRSLQEERQQLQKALTELTNKFVLLTAEKEMLVRQSATSVHADAALQDARAEISRLHRFQREGDAERSGTVQGMRALSKAVADHAHAHIRWEREAHTLLRATEGEFRAQRDAAVSCVAAAEADASQLAAAALEAIRASRTYVRSIQLDFSARIKQAAGGTATELRCEVARLRDLVSEKNAHNRKLLDGASLASMALSSVQADVLSLEARLAQVASDDGQQLMVDVPGRGSSTGLLHAASAQEGVLSPQRVNLSAAERLVAELASLSAVGFSRPTTATASPSSAMGVSAGGGSSSEGALLRPDGAAARHVGSSRVPFVAATDFAAMRISYLEKRFQMMGMALWGRAMMHEKVIQCGIVNRFKMQQAQLAAASKERPFVQAAVVDVSGGRSLVHLRWSALAAGLQLRRLRASECMRRCQAVTIHDLIMSLDRERCAACGLREECGRLRVELNAITTGSAEVELIKRRKSDQNEPYATGREASHPRVGQLSKSAMHSRVANSTASDGALLMLLQRMAGLCSELEEADRAVERSIADPLEQARSMRPVDALQVELRAQRDGVIGAIADASMDTSTGGIAAQQLLRLKGWGLGAVLHKLALQRRLAEIETELRAQESAAIDAAARGREREIHSRWDNIRRDISPTQVPARGSPSDRATRADDRRSKDHDVRAGIVPPSSQEQNKRWPEWRHSPPPRTSPRRTRFVTRREGKKEPFPCA